MRPLKAAAAAARSAGAMRVPALHGSGISAGSAFTTERTDL